MYRARIVTVGRPPSAKAGESITVDARVANDGDEDGYFLVTVAYLENGEGRLVDSGWQWVSPGPAQQFLLYFSMPNNDIIIITRAYHYDFDPPALVLDDTFMDLPITLFAPVIKAEITGLMWRSSAPAGDNLPFLVHLKNVGNLAGYLIGCLPWQTGATDGVVWGEWRFISPGDTEQWDLPFTMPNQDLTVWFQGLHWDEVAEVGILDHTRGPYLVELEVTPTPNPPHPYIFEPTPITEAHAGASVPYGAYVLNDGGTGAYFRLRVNLEGVNYSDVLYSPARWIDPGAATTLSGTFPMPDLDIEARLQAEWWDGQGAVWILDGNVVVHTIAVIHAEIPYLALPISVLAVLEATYYNFPRGDWISVEISGIGIVLPPFSFTPGYWVRDALNWVLSGINWVIEWVREGLRIGREAWDNASSALAQVSDWLAGAVGWFTTQVDQWWTVTFEIVKTWVDTFLDALRSRVDQMFSDLTGLDVRISNLVLDFNDFKANFIQEITTTEPFATIITAVNRIVDIVDALPGELWDFFSNPAGWIFDKIDDWLNEIVE